MTKTRTISSTFLAAAFLFASVASAQDKKPGAAPAAAAKAAAPGAKAPAAAPAAAAAAPAAMQQPIPPSGPPKELEAFFMGAEGSWKCESKMPAGAMGPGTPEMTAKTTTKIKKEMGGMWWRGDWAMAKSKAMPAVNGTFLVGYDPGSKQAIVTAYDSTGATSLAAGPINGDTVTYSGEGYFMGMKVKTRESMSVRGKEAVHKLEIDMGKGFQNMGEDTCKK